MFINGEWQVQGMFLLHKSVQLYIVSIMHKIQGKCLKFWLSESSVVGTSSKPKNALCKLWCYQLTGHHGDVCFLKTPGVVLLEQ